jgi:hypothetical protein
MTKVPTNIKKYLILYFTITYRDMLNANLEYYFALSFIIVGMQSPAEVSTRDLRPSNGLGRRLGAEMMCGSVEAGPKDLRLH